MAVVLPVLMHFSWSILYHYYSQLAYEQGELAKAAYGLTPAVSGVTLQPCQSAGGNPRTGELMDSLGSGLWAWLQPLIAAVWFLCSGTAPIRGCWRERG